MSKEIATHLKVTTINAQLLLRPSESLNKCIEEVIAESQKKRRVTIYAITVLSNQLHILYKKPTTSPYSFQNEILKLIETKVKFLLAKNGHVWDPTFTEYPALSQTALVETYLKVSCKAVEKSLVPFPHLWPGVSQHEGSEINFKQLPLLRSLNDEEYKETIASLIKSRANSIAISHVKNRKSFLKTEAITSQSPFSFPKNYKRKANSISIEQILEAMPQQPESSGVNH